MTGRQPTETPDSPDQTVAAHAPASPDEALAREPHVGDALPALAQEMRARYIAEAAYFMALEEGFPPDAAVRHWLAAEAQIEHRLAAAEAA